VTRFERLLDKPSKVRILDVLITKDTFGATQAGLQELTGLSQPMISRSVRALVDEGIVEEVEANSRTGYRFDRDHPAADALKHAHRALQSYTTETQAASEDYDPGDMADGSPFVELFRYPTNVKLLAPLLLAPSEQVRKTALARAADVDTSTVSDNIDLLCEVGVLRRVKSTLDDSVAYTLDDEHAAGEAFQAMIESLNPEPAVTRAAEGEDGPAALEEDLPVSHQARTAAQLANELPIAKLLDGDSLSQSSELRFTGRIDGDQITEILERSELSRVGGVPEETGSPAESAQQSQDAEEPTESTKTDEWGKAEARRYHGVHAHPPTASA
jgi:predicted transcriptional regulator